MSEQLLARSRSPIVLYLDLYPFIVNNNCAEFLLLKRSTEVPLAGTWQFVSGKIQKDERIGSAFWRMAKEKVGAVPARIFKLNYVNTFYDDQLDSVLLVPSAACELTCRDVTLSDLHVEYRWARAEEALGMAKWPAQRHCINLVCEMVREQSHTEELVAISKGS